MNTWTRTGLRGRYVLLALLLALSPACAGDDDAARGDATTDVTISDGLKGDAPLDAPQPVDVLPEDTDAPLDLAVPDTADAGTDVSMDYSCFEDALCNPCGAGEALHGETCIPCATACDAAGETGTLWPSASQSGKCICETEPGWYYTEGIDIGTYPCDQDGDGWIVESARLSTESDDPAVAENARCALRRINRVLLQNEADETRTVTLAELVPDYAGDHLPLYEPDHLDDQSLQKWMDLPHYGDRALEPAELNPLVKYCVDADYNGNGIKDFQEWHDIHATVPANPHLAPFVAFAYFGELHRGWYEEPSEDQLYGTYHIKEKPRPTTADGGDEIPVVYDEAYELSHGADTAEDTAKMYQCHLWPRTGFDPEDAIPEVNRDFQRLGPETPSMDFARTVEVAPGEYMVVPEDHWEGMNHHNQFRCVQFVNTPPENPDAEPNKLVVDDFSDGEGLLLQLNQCTASLNTEGAPSSQPPVVGQNPASPELLCLPVTLDSVEGGTVGWSAIRYRTGSKGTWGCVDQCAASPGCGLCGQGVWLSQDGKKCGLETTTAGYAGIPSSCMDIDHPEDLSWEGYVCDGCGWQDQCDDGDDCTINLCHVDADEQCAALIPTPNDFSCPDDDNDCTMDFCNDGVCIHPPKAPGTACAGSGQCKDWLCGGGGIPNSTLGQCLWLPKTNQACTLTNPSECLKSKCNASGTCGQSKTAGTSCTQPDGGDDGNACTAPECENGACVNMFIGEGETCVYDDSECTEDVCTAEITGFPEGLCYGDPQPLQNASCTQDVPATCDASVCKAGNCTAKGTICDPNITATCNICGSKTCTDQCQWGECTGWEDSIDTGDFPLGSMNESKMTATDLGTFNDDPAPGNLTTYGTLVPGNDIDWYRLKINDTCCEPYPGVTVIFQLPSGYPSVLYEIGASWECVNDSNNKLVWDQDPALGAAVFEFKSLNCDGDADDVYLYIGITYSDATPNKTCQQYSFTIDFD